jgi:hypothetical protein
MDEKWWVTNPRARRRSKNANMAKNQGNRAEMARTSAAAQATVASAIPCEPMPPPPDLPPEQQKDWQDLVGNLPSNWFSTHDKPLLVELVRHQAIARQLSAEIAKMRRWSLNDLSARTAKRRAIFVRLLRSAVLESETIARLCTRLRLTPQSQQRSRDAGIARSRSASGPRPCDG